MTSISIHYISCLVVVLLVVHYRPNFKARKALSSIPTHAIDDAEYRQLQGDEDHLIESGCKKNSKVNGVFKMKDPTGKFRIILPQKYGEIKCLKSSFQFPRLSQRTIEHPIHWVSRSRTLGT